MHYSPILFWFETFAKISILQRSRFLVMELRPAPADTAPPSQAQGKNLSNQINLLYNLFQQGPVCPTTHAKGTMANERTNMT